MPEDQENLPKKKNPLKQFTERLRGLDKETQEVVDRFVEFLDEKDGGGWMSMREYEKEGTGFEWWEDPLAEGAVVVATYYNFPNWRRSDESVEYYQRYFIVGVNSSDKHYPPVYQLGLDRTERELIQIPSKLFDRREYVNRRVEKKVFDKEDKEKLKNLMVCINVSTQS